MAHLSGAVYDPWPIAEIAAKGHGYDFLPIDPGNDAQAMIVSNSAEAIAVFRGTEFTKGNLSDIMSNLQSWPTQWAGRGRVHAGYVHHFDRIWDRVEDALVPHMKAGKNLHLTGHSLGGVLATLSALYCVTRPLDIETAWTFGAPKCLTKSNRNMILAEFYRVADVVDFAPSHPCYAPWLHHPAGERAHHLEVHNPGLPLKVARHSVERYWVAAGQVPDPA